MPLGRWSTNLPLLFVPVYSYCCLKIIYQSITFVVFHHLNCFIQDLASIYFSRSQHSILYCRFSTLFYLTVILNYHREESSVQVEMKNKRSIGTENISVAHICSMWVPFLHQLYAFGQEALFSSSYILLVTSHASLLKIDVVLESMLYQLHYETAKSLIFICNISTVRLVIYCT